MRLGQRYFLDCIGGTGYHMRLQIVMSLLQILHLHFTLAPRVIGERAADGHVLFEDMDVGRACGHQFTMAGLLAIRLVVEASSADLVAHKVQLLGGGVAATAHLLSINFA